MSSVVIAGDTSGTVTLDAPAVAGTTVLTLPATSGTVLTSSSTTMPAGSVNQAALAAGVAGNGPAFRAAPSTAQTITTATYTKVTLGTETFDTNGNFASSRFTPTVAGYYQINTSVNLQATTSLSSVVASIYRNGVFYSFVSTAPSSSQAGAVGYSDIVYCNGTTDYIEMYARAVGTGTITVRDDSAFSGALVRAA